MGCGVSRPDEDDDVVSLCRERKRLLKSAIERRYSLADAHSRYNDSLNGVAAAIKLFVARHSSPLSPFLITFPTASDIDATQPSNPMFLQQTPSESTHEAIGCKSSDSVISSDSSEGESENEGEEEGEGGVCDHFYEGMAPPVPLPQGDFEWDFFYPFDTVRTEVGLDNGFRRTSDDDDLRRIRQQEGIPELEEDGAREKGERKVVVQMNGGGVEGMTAAGEPSPNQEHKGLRVIDTEASGRELLEALKDVEDHFVRAYESGFDVSRLLEVNRVHLLSSLEEIKESPKKLVRSITWNRSNLSRSSSSKTFLAPGSKSSSTWSELGNDLIDDYEGMASGSLSQTLERLYAWEKKLYEEVKAGDETRRTYERKCSHLKKQDDSGDGLHSVDKTSAEVNDLYTRILVGLQSAESISKRIEKLRDEELLPQLVELLQGLIRIWKIMLESHETQNKIMSEVKSFTCPSYGKFCNDSHRLATFQLETELQNWRACFAEYFSAQKAYIEALNGWLSKFIAPEVEFYSRIKSSGPPYEIRGPLLLVICRHWLASLEKLPDKLVKCTMKSFGKDIRAIWVQQGEEQQQKRKVDGLAKELDRRVHAFKRAQSRILESKVPEQNKEADIRYRIEYLSEREGQLDDFRKRLDAEKAKHLGSMQETQQITLNAFQIGFFSVFESLTEFSKASLKMYDDLVTFCASYPKVGDERSDKPCYIMADMGN